MAKKRPEPTIFDRMMHQIVTEGANGPMVYRAARNGRKEVIIRRETVVDIREQITRIQQQADPIGFMMAVVEGQVFEVPLVMEVEAENDLGEKVKVLKEVPVYESPTLKQRMEAAKFLANKIMPTLSVQQVQVKDMREQDAAESDDQKYNPLGEPGQPSFAQIVHAAASQAKEVKPLPMRVVMSVPEAGEPAMYAGSAGDGELPEDEPESGNAPDP